MAESFCNSGMDTRRSIDIELSGMVISSGVFFLSEFSIFVEPSLFQSQCKSDLVFVLNGTDEVSRSCSAICFS